MIYFSLDSIVQAYQNNSRCTSNKFWGVLGILHAIKMSIKSGTSYKFDPRITAEFLQNLFCLGEKKQFSGMRNQYYIIFSIDWISKFRDIMCPLTPDFTDVAIWMFRNHGFNHHPSIAELKSMFIQKTHLDEKQLNEIFNFSHRSIQYTATPVSDKELLHRLNLIYNNREQYTSISAEGSFIKANPGEFSRAPFIQTIYAAQRAPECLLLTQFNVLTSYGLTSSSKL
ncbi:MAG: hypothetical protein HDS37_01515 [Bacteroides sp.]|nr:hypothetical protein [Bacteroides sp.]